MKIQWNLLFGIVLSCLVSHVCAASVLNIVCEQNTGALSQLFEQNWEELPNKNYLSYVRREMSDQLFTGALHTKNKMLPSDKNPHLNYAGLALSRISHYQLWQVDCYYNIDNPQVQDLEDGYLHMTLSLDANLYHCKQIENKSVVCTQ